MTVDPAHETPTPVASGPAAPGPADPGAAARAQDEADRLHAAHPEFDEVPLLETDETVPPRPEEDAADASRD